MEHRAHASSEYRVLEGNPVVPDHYVPLTRANFRTYDEELLRLAMDAIRDR